VGLKKFLAILAAGAILLIVLAAWFLPLDEDFRVENPLWNGFKNLSTNYPVQSLDSFASLPFSPRGTTFILVPYLSLTPAELEQLNGYISQGGRLILADDYGHGNQILEYLGLAVRFSGDVLLDPLANYKNNRYLPEIIHLRPNPLTTNTESLGFNHATSLVNTDNASVIALSSSFSFLDTNDNGSYDDDEPTGPFPVIYRANVGSGQVVMIADPSLFINSMNEIDENEDFIQNIAATTGSLYLDQSHLPPSDLHRTKNLLARVREYLASPLVTAGLVALAVAITLKPIWYRSRERPENIRDYL
jgi:hypothetical protein